MFCLESFKMIANGVSSFLSFSLQLAITRFTLLILKKKSRFVEGLLFCARTTLNFFPFLEALEDSK